MEFVHSLKSPIEGEFHRPLIPAFSPSGRMGFFWGG
jgi:hypothetical protein